MWEAHLLLGSEMFWSSFNNGNFTGTLDISLQGDQNEEY
jgi:hypothetical protein